MQSYENHDEVGIFELTDLIRRNFKLIIWSVITGLLIAIIFSTFSLFLNKNVAKYNLTTNMSLTGDDITEQTVTIIVNSFTHSSILTPVVTKLGLSPTDYQVLAKRGDSVGILQLIVEGTETSSLTRLSNEVFNMVKPLVETAIPNMELRKLEISTPKPLLQSTRANVNWIRNSVLGFLLGGMLSVLYVLVVYFMSPNIIKDGELETLFNTRILGKFANKSQKPTIRKFLEVK